MQPSPAPTTETRRSHGDRGQATVLLVLMLIVLVAVSALAVDGGSWFLTRRDMQGDADAGAMAGARGLLASPDVAYATASDYATTQNAQDEAQIDWIDVAGDTVSVGVKRPGNGSFLGIFPMTEPTIHARATARIMQVAGLAGMLPFGLLDGTYQLGEQYPIKTADNATGNRGVIAPPTGDSCAPSSGAGDYRELLASYDASGSGACMVAVGETVGTQTGNVSGPTRQGLDARLSGNTQALEDVFSFDEQTGRWSVTDGDSPRIGIVPILSALDGTADWPSGQSEQMVVEGYVMVYIGDTTSPPNYPPYSDNGKTVYVTPLLSLLPEELAAIFADTFDPSSPNPVTVRLVE